MASAAVPHLLFRILPLASIAAGGLVMFALRNPLAVFSGLLLMAAGGIDLLRRARFQRELAHSELETTSRITSRMSQSLEGDSTLSLIQLSWRRSFECGHPVIDAQHRALFEIGDGLISAATKEKSRDHIEFLLDELTEHIQEHFSTEEAVMARTKYPLSAQHQAHHAALLAKARSLRDAYRKHQLDLGDLVSFIAYELITDHILKEDLKFALKERVPTAA
jgi:hemerythrin-like metal-binding protein